MKPMRELRKMPVPTSRISIQGPHAIPFRKSTKFENPSITNFYLLIPLCAVQLSKITNFTR